MPEHVPATVPDPLLTRLEATRSEMRRYGTLMGVITLGLAVLGLCSILIVADWAWVLDVPIRAAGLLAVGLASIALGVRLFVIPSRHQTRDGTAEDVEAGFPGLGQRVRTTLEYLEPDPTTAPASPGLVGALRSDTQRRTSNLDFRTLVPWPKLRVAVVGTALLILGCGLFLSEQPELRMAARRVFLMSGHFTRLEVEPGDAKIEAGSAFTLTATIEGRPVDQARWFHRRSGSQEDWTAVSLNRLTENDSSGRSARLVGTLTATLEDCRDDLDYRVVAGRVESPTYHVTLIQPLVLKRHEATVSAPAYTHRKKVRSTSSDLKIIEGSDLAFQFEFNRELERGTLNQVGTTSRPGENQTRASTAQSGSSGPLEIPLTVNGSVLFGAIGSVHAPITLRLYAAARDATVEPLSIKIRIQPDEKPSIRFVKPVERLAVIPTTEVPIEVAAADDFGITQVGIIYQVGNGPKETLLLDKYQDEPVTANGLATLYLEKHALAFNDAITYFAFAEDNHPGTPNRMTTELRFIDILPFQEEFQLDEGGGSCSGSSASLEELISRQRENLGRSFALSAEPKVDGETAGRLAAFEKELEAATREFTDALEAKLGPVPPLHQALEAMASAVADLEKASVGSAQPEEESALASLIKARMNLRKLLKEKPSSSACRQIDRQQQQKIRKPPPKKDDQAGARLPEELKKLAREERSICQGINPSSMQGSGLSSAVPSNDTPSEAKKPGEAQPGLAERQSKAALTAQELQKKVHDDAALSGLAQSRMDEVAKTVRQGADHLNAGEREKGAGQASKAADQLERLAEQVAGLKAKELADKLARARDLAGKLANEEKELAGQASNRSKSPEAERPPAPGRSTETKPADRQRGLADEAETLGDWLRRIETQAAEENRELGQSVRRATQANPPREIIDGMRAAAHALQGGKGEHASADLDEAARQLEALTRDLETARRAYVQPRLDQLLAAEKQASRAQSALRAARDASGKAVAEKALSDLVTTMESIKAGEGRLAAAADKLAEGLQRHGGWGGEAREARGQTEPGQPVLLPPGEYTEGVTNVLTALQARIQEMILKDVLMDSDEAVPPQYQNLVDDYYRALSQDLR